MDRRTLLALFLYFIFIGSSAQAQPSRTDSMISRLSAVSRKEKATLLNSIAESYLPANPHMCMVFAGKATELSLKLKDSMQLGFANKNLGAANATLYQYDEAMKAYLVSLNIFQRTGNKSQVAAVHMNIGLVMRERNDYEKAMGHFQLALDIYKQISELSGQARANQMLGSLALRRAKYAIAIDKYRIAYSIRLSLKNQDDIAQSLNYLALAYKEQNQFDSAVFYYNRVIELRSKSKNKGLYANTLNETGDLYWNRHDYEKALGYYFRAVKLRYETGDKPEIANSYQNIGNLYSTLGNFEKAREYYQQALKINMESDDKRKIASTLTVLGNLEDQTQNYQDALNYFIKALNYRKAIGEKKEISISLNNLGNIYSELGNTTMAISFFNEALAMRREIRDSNGEIITLNGLGILCEKTRSEGMALSYFESARKLAEETGNTLYIGICCRKIAENYLAQNHTDNVESLIVKSMEAGNAIHNSELIKLGHFDLFQLFKLKGNYEKALEHYQEYTQIKDSLQFAQHSLQMISIQQNLELEKKNNEIKSYEGEVSKLEQEKEKQEDKLLHERILVIFLVFFFCFSTAIAGLIYNRYKIRKKSNRQLQTQNEKLEDANTKLKKIEVDLNRLNATKDKYFAIIAHDLKNPLNSLLNFSQLIIERYDSLKDEEIKEFNSHIHNAASNINDLLENLLNWARANTNRLDYNPEQISLLPVVKSIYSLHALMAQQKNVKLQIDIIPSIQVYADIHMLSLILRNLISNALKFTPEGGEISIKAIETITRVEVSVADTGIGISPSDVDKLFRIESGFTTPGTANETGSGLGLLLVKEFVEKNKGQVYVNSIKGKGTTFTFSLPNYS